MSRYIRSQSEELLDDFEDDDIADHVEPDEDGFLPDDLVSEQWYATLDNDEVIVVCALHVEEAAEEAVALAEVEYPDCVVVKIERA